MTSRPVTLDPRTRDEEPCNWATRLQPPSQTDRFGAHGVCRDMALPSQFGAPSRQDPGGVRASTR
jgi:hypothetical protein